MDGPKLYAGSLADFDVDDDDIDPDLDNDSMAKAIEDALAELLGPLPTAPDKLVRDRRYLFIAISRGVIKHLKANEKAFRINVETFLDLNVSTVTASADLVIDVKD